MCASCAWRRQRERVASKPSTRYCGCEVVVRGRTTGQALGAYCASGWLCVNSIRTDSDDCFGRVMNKGYYTETSDKGGYSEVLFIVIGM